MHGLDQFLRLGQALGLKGTEHIAQGRHGQDARGELLRTHVGILCQVKHGVGQRLQSGGRGADLQATELWVGVGWGDDRLGHGALVHRAIDGKGLGRGRRIDR